MRTCPDSPDKCDRYLAEVFVGQAVSKKLKAVSPRPESTYHEPSVSSFQPTAEDYVFLNSALLSAGHATPYDGGAKEE